jgi:hypothetical protein
VTLTGRVLPGTPGSALRPTGIVSFFEGSTALTPQPVTLNADPDYLSNTFAQVFGAIDRNLAGTLAGGLVGDFNGDGIPDLLVYSNLPVTNLTFQVFQGTGGGFQSLPVQSFTFATPSFPLTFSTLDVDGDGNLDLLIGNMAASGKGDGTFGQPAVLSFLAPGFDQTYAADANGDGKEDIVAVNAPPRAIDTAGSVQFTFTVFRNDGGGHFTNVGVFPLHSYTTGGGCCVLYNIFGLSFGDLNGDGKVDLVSQSNALPDGNAASTNNLDVMLNNGDGTFGAPMPIHVSAVASPSLAGIVFADLDGNGTQDLVFDYDDFAGANYVAAALGHGDGTFASFNTLLLWNHLNTPVPLPHIEVTDLNSDGKPDVVTHTGNALLGNGDGTFTQTPATLFPQLWQTLLYEFPLLRLPVFPHRQHSVVYLDTQQGDNAVFTPEVSSSGSGKVALSAGSHTITAHYFGDATYEPFDSTPVAITVAPAASQMSLTSSRDPSITGQAVTFTAQLSHISAAAGGTVTFSKDFTPLATVPVMNGMASYNASFDRDEPYTISAEYSGDGNNIGSEANLTQTVTLPIIVLAPNQLSYVVTVTSSQSVSIPLNITGAEGLTGQVSLSCGSLPTYATCAFNPATVALSGSAAASTTMTLSTSVASSPAVRAENSWNNRALILACGVPFVALLLLPAGRGGRLFCVVLLLVPIAALNGCAGGHQSTTVTQTTQTLSTAPGTYNFYVVASTGSLTSQTQFTLNVR